MFYQSVETRRYRRLSVGRELTFVLRIPSAEWHAVFLCLDDHKNQYKCIHITVAVSINCYFIDQDQSSNERNRLFYMKYDIWQVVRMFEYIKCTGFTAILLVMQEGEG